MTDDHATWPAPFAVTWVERTGSTNDDLVAEARRGAAHGTVLVADEQTAGKGRLGRQWSSPPGAGLLCSVVLHPAEGAPLHGGQWAMALAAARACQDLAGVTARIKWPNDLMVGHRKLAGVLAESVIVGQEVVAVVVGLGLNVGWASAPPEVADRAVTLGELAGHEIDREALLEALLLELAPLLELWATRPGELTALYRGELATVGQHVHVVSGDVELDGVAVDVTDDGALVVEAPDGETVVTVGDVLPTPGDPPEPRPGR